MESPSSAESASPAATLSAAPEASPTATPTPVPNILSFAIVREWPKTEKDLSAAALLNGDEWKSPPDATGPFVFVFELPAPASIDHFVIASSSSPDVGAKAVMVEGSTTSADSGYTEIGSYEMDPNGAAMTGNPTPSAAHPRWLRVTLEPRGPKGMDLRQFEAYGALDAVTPAKSIAGTWLLDPWTKLAPPQDLMWLLPGKLPAAPQWKALAKSHFLLKVIQFGAEFRVLECNDDGTYADTLGGTQDGANVSWLPVRGSSALQPGAMNPDGTVFSGPGYMALRVSDANGCRPPDPPKGAGKKVLVLNTIGKVDLWEPYDHPEEYPGYRFIPTYVAQFSPAQLAGVDTIDLNQVCEASTIFAKAQSDALLAFVSAGHKLIMHDADGCPQSGYAFVPYPFTTLNVGAKGQHGNDLVLVESSTLGSDNKDPARFIDAGAWAGNPLNQLGDANVVVSEDPHWCAHLYGTNANAGGFMHMYAPYGLGLLIYDGFDVDDRQVPQYRKLLALEFAQTVPFTATCTQPVIGKFMIAPSSEQKLPQGSATTLRVPLKVLSNRSYTGAIDITAAGPPDAPWPTEVRPKRMSVQKAITPFDFAIHVPADAHPGQYVFKVTGTDARGQTALATLTFDVANVPPKKIESALATQKRIAIYGIHFDFNSATVRPESQAVIHDIADILKAHPDWKLTIEGHTDNVGSAAYNLDLSKRRAEAVKTILVSRYSIASARLSSAGLGLTRPKASNATEAGRAENRRVELVRQ